MPIAQPKGPAAVPTRAAGSAAPRRALPVSTSPVSENASQQMTASQTAQTGTAADSFAPGRNGARTKVAGTAHLPQNDGGCPVREITGSESDCSAGIGRSTELSCRKLSQYARIH